MACRRRPALAASLLVGLLLLLYALGSSLSSPASRPLAGTVTREDASVWDTSLHDSEGAGGAKESSPSIAVPIGLRNELDQRGVPLLDEYPGPTRWNISVQLPGWQPSSYAVGKGNKTAKLCSGRDHDHVTKMKFTPWGFGSNLLVMVDAIIYSSAIKTDSPFVLVDTRSMPNLDHTRAETGSKEKEKSKRDKLSSPKLPLESAFISTFSFADKHDSICRDYCQACKTCAMGGADVECGNIEHRIIHDIKAFEKKLPSIYYSMVVDVMRLITRVKPSIHEAVARQLAQFANDWHKTVVIHVRRGDKLIREATKTPTSTYLGFMLDIEKRQGWEFSRIVVVSDDHSIAAEIDQAVPSNHKARVVVRADTARVDQPKTLEEAHLAEKAAMITTISDLKAMASAKWFIGTSSSSFGRTACVLRGGYQCVNAERGDGIWGIPPGQQPLWRGVLGAH